jgi:hypothetical protein
MNFARQCTDPAKRRAHQILDQVRGGFPHPIHLITWALTVLGDLGTA